MTSTFRTLTVPLDAETFPGGLPSFLVRDDVLCWTRREAGLVGFGEIARFTATGPERFLEADIWWRHLVLEADIEDAVDCPGTGPVAFGSFAFSKVSAHESRLLVPEIVVGLRDGQAWLTQLTLDDAELTEAGARSALARWLGSAGANASAIGDGANTDSAVVDDPLPGAAQAGGAVVVRPLPLAAGATLHTGSLSEEDWMAAVAAGVEEIRTGALEKLVLARDVVATVPTGVNAAQVLRELSARYRECWTYGVDGLVGATPEMLIQVEGRTAQARVLAGTLDRRDADGLDGSPLEFAERVLAGSEKQRHEHDIAIQSLTTQLGEVRQFDDDGGLHHGGQGGVAKVGAQQGQERANALAAGFHEVTRRCVSQGIGIGDGFAQLLLDARQVGGERGTELRVAGNGREACRQLEAGGDRRGVEVGFRAGQAVSGVRPALVCRVGHGLTLTFVAESAELAPVCGPLSVVGVA